MRTFKFRCTVGAEIRPGSLAVAVSRTASGSYSADGDRLTFGQLVGTMMACPQGMELERAFHDALARVAIWRIDGERLEFFDAAGDSVA